MKICIYISIEHNYMRKYHQKFAILTFMNTVCLRRSSEVEISGTRSWAFANKCFTTLTLTLSCASKLVLMSSEFSVYATYPVNCPKWTRNHKCSVCLNSKKTKSLNGSMWTFMKFVVQNYKWNLLLKSIKLHFWQLILNNFGSIFLFDLQN